MVTLIVANRILHNAIALIDELVSGVGVRVVVEIFEILGVGC